MIADEVERSTEQYGPLQSKHQGHSIIEEEYDEFWDEVKANNIPRAKEELVQLAAMCVCFLRDIPS